MSPNEGLDALSLVHNTTLTLTMTMTLDVDTDADANDDVVPFTIFSRERHETLVSTCLDTRAFFERMLPQIIVTPRMYHRWTKNL